MQTSRIIFQDDLVTTFCSACLSADRKLYRLFEFRDIFKQICENVLPDLDTEIFLCFECLALLRNVKKFQEKVQNSQNILKSFIKDDNEKNLLSNFSNLCTSEADVLDCSEPVDNEVLDNVKLDLAADIKPETEYELEEADSDNEPLEESQIVSPSEINLNNFNVSDNEPLEDLQIVSPPETNLNDFNVSDNESLEESQIASPPETNLNDFNVSDNEPLEESQIVSPPETNLNDFNVSDNDTLEESQIASPSDTNFNESEIVSQKEQEISKDESNTPKTLNGEELKETRSNRQNVADCVASGKKVDKKVKNKSKLYQSESYKIIYLENSSDFFYKKVAIQTEEIKYWLERERNSTYFKKLKYKCLKCICALSAVHKEIQNHARLHKQRLQYTCDICTMSFASKGVLRKHIKNHYYIRCCATCEFKCVSKMHMYIHVKKEHSTRAVQCLECKANFKEKKKFFIHYRKEHYVKDIFVCDYCKKKCGRRRTLEKHIFSRHSRHLCVICNTTYSRKNGLAAHIKLKHSVERTEDTYCVKCDRQFDNKLQFKHHLKAPAHADERTTVKKKQSHPCPDCPKVYTKKCSMKQHYNGHHGRDKLRFQCSYCDKKYNINSLLQDHIKYTHQGHVRERKYTCACRVSLLIHMRTHTGERPHECPQCDSKFAQKITLNKHMRSHTGERPYECPQCGSKFAQTSGLQTHMRIHTGERPFQCPHCDSNFAQHSPFLNHVRRIHKKESYRRNTNL